MSLQAHRLGQRLIRKMFAGAPPKRLRQIESPVAHRALRIDAHTLLERPRRLVIPKIVIKVEALVEPRLGFGRCCNPDVHVPDPILFLRHRQFVRGHLILRPHRMAHRPRLAHSPRRSTEKQSHPRRGNSHTGPFPPVRSKTQSPHSEPPMTHHQISATSTTQANLSNRINSVILSLSDKDGRRDLNGNPSTPHCSPIPAHHGTAFHQSRVTSHFFTPLISRPPWCKTKCVTSPFSFLKNSISASTTFRKNIVSDSAKTGNFGCPVACVIN